MKFRSVNIDKDSTILHIFPSCFSQENEQETAIAQKFTRDRCNENMKIELLSVRNKETDLQKVNHCNQSRLHILLHQIHQVDQGHHFE